MKTPQRVDEIVDTVKQTADHLSSRAHRTVVEAQQTVRQAAVDRGIGLARKVADWIEPAARSGYVPDVKVEVESAVRDSVWTAIPGYDHLNVRELDDRVRAIDDVTLLAVIASYERDHKDRKTVARSIERQLRRLQPHVAPAPDWMRDQDAA